MGFSFNWFKKYKITDLSGKGYSLFDLQYFGGGSTSHSAHNVMLCDDLFEKTFGVRIPMVYDEYIQSTDEDLELIEPQRMSKMCDAILQSTDVDKIGMRNRFEWFKKLSDEGYYLAYGW